MALPQGINFRSTLGYVTDGANEFAEYSTGGNYPTTSAQGNNVGWEAGSGTVAIRNRNSGNDRRLAGCNFNTTTSDYRIDLPSTGDKVIRVAFGDANYSRSNQKCEIFDTSSSLGTLFSAASTGAANSFLDAGGTARTAAAWPGSNTSATKTFTTTICRFRVGDGSNDWYVAHVYVEDGAAAAGQPTAKRFGGVPGMGQGQQFARRVW